MIGKKMKSLVDCFLTSPRKCIKHTSYFRVYEHLLAPLRNSKVTFVEIGVLDGGSLHMWREYLGSEARIIGVDNNPDAKRLESDGFEIYIGNQSDETFWNEFKCHVNEIDVLLDDGGHTYEQQITTVENVSEVMKDNSLIIIEDTHTSYMPGFGNTKYSFLQYTKSKLDAINFRCASLPSNNVESRFWSIEIFESIVVFRFNKKAIVLQSQEIGNGKSSDGAVDNRNVDIPFFSSLRKAKKFFMKYSMGRFLIKLLSPLIPFYYNFFSSSKKLKKFFF
jgi:hypothetical protein